VHVVEIVVVSWVVVPVVRLAVVVGVGDDGRRIVSLWSVLRIEGDKIGNLELICCCCCFHDHGCSRSLLNRMMIMLLSETTKLDD
jgi:hypothetical protein